MHLHHRRGCCCSCSCAASLTCDKCARYLLGCPKAALLSAVVGTMMGFLALLFFWVVYASLCNWLLTPSYTDSVVSTHFHPKVRRREAGTKCAGGHCVEGAGEATYLLLPQFACSFGHPRSLHGFFFFPCVFDPRSCCCINPAPPPFCPRKDYWHWLPALAGFGIGAIKLLPLGRFSYPEKTHGFFRKISSLEVPGCRLKDRQKQPLQTSQQTYRQTTHGREP